MNKQLLFSSLAAAALLSGCRVYMPGESPRRTVFGSTPASSSRTAAEVPAARVDGVPAAAPAGDLVAPQPVAPAPAPAAAPVLPATAGANSYLNYLGGGASASPAPRRAAPASAAPAPAAAGGSYRMYTVQPGDSAGVIANSNGMTLDEFAKLNGLSDPDRLRVGQTVKIAAGRSALAAGPAARPERPVSAPAGSVVVRDGDTLSAIASRNGTTVKALMEANGISDPDRLRVGTALRLPGAASVAPVPAAPPAPAPVQAAETPVPTAPAETPVVSLPTPTTRPPRSTRRPARVTPDEASAAPGSTVTAGDATIDVDAALSGGGLGAARQRARQAAQDAAGQVREAAQAAGDQAQSALGQVSDAAGRAADAVSSAAAAGTQEYVVQEQDDIYSIAMKFDASPLKIRSLNGGKSLDDLVPGDRILVPAK